MISDLRDHYKVDGDDALGPLQDEAKRKLDKRQRSPSPVINGNGAKRQNVEEKGASEIEENQICPNGLGFDLLANGFCFKEHFSEKDQIMNPVKQTVKTKAFNCGDICELLTLNGYCPNNHTQEEEAIAL